jgi:hypothetical protein
MDINTYKLLHVIGIIVLFVSLGMMLGAGKSMKSAACGHGIGLILILVSGFGLSAKLKLGFPAWMMGKLAIWLALGAVMVLIKRKALPVPGVAAIVIALGAIAAWIVFQGRYLG